MPVSTMAPDDAHQFDSRKAYQAQEEQTPFVSLLHVFAPRAID